MRAALETHCCGSNRPRREAERRQRGSSALRSPWGRNVCLLLYSGASAGVAALWAPSFVRGSVQSECWRWEGCPAPLWWRKCHVPVVLLRGMCRHLKAFCEQQAVSTLFRCQIKCLGCVGWSCRAGAGEELEVGLSLVLGWVLPLPAGSKQGCV